MNHLHSSLRRRLPLWPIPLLLALVINELTLERFLSPDGTLESLNRVLLAIFDFALLVAALALWSWRVELSVAVLLVNAVLVVVLLSGLEIGLYALVHWTPLVVAGARFQNLKRELHWLSVEFVQFRRQCAQHDDLLGYTLRPGSCTFSATEFRTRLEINHLGMRDDEESLASPEIIVLGDSYAMGWGVEGDETFAQILEDQGGAVVLNAGVSSYGTAREILSLDRVNTERLQVLVIQYGSNDLNENRTYTRNGNRLAVMSSDDYERRVRELQEQRHYHFGRYLTFLLENRARVQNRALIRMLSGDPASPAATPSRDVAEVEAFIGVLRSRERELRDVEILVLELGPWGYWNRGFVDALQSSVDAGRARDLRIRTVDVAPFLEAGNYFRLDPHINPSGHAIVAEALLAAIDDLPVLSDAG